MAKTRKPNQDHEEKIMKENIQKRFEHMFTGEGEPLSNMSLQEAEALKSRVAELESRLTEQDQQPSAPKPAPSSIEREVHSSPIVTRVKSPSGTGR
jgi:hypothetical protein